MPGNSEVVKSLGLIFIFAAEYRRQVPFPLTLRWSDTPRAEIETVSPACKLRAEPSSLMQGSTNIPYTVQT